MASENPKAYKHPCTAKSRTTGERCKRPAIKGGSVCRYHGGAAPQVISSAKARLTALVDPAIGKLEVILKNNKHPQQLAAVRDVLDRCGFKPKDEIEVTDVNRRLEVLRAGRERARKAREE